MNSKKIILTLAGVLTVGLIVLLVVNRPAPAPSSSDRTGTGTPTTTNPSVTGTAPSPAVREYRKWSLPKSRLAVSTPPATTQLVELPGADGQPATPGVKLQAGQVLATVNQIPITVADLMPMPAGQTDVTMDAAEYDARLTKAVEAEVTLQAARRQNVSLQPAQQDRIAAIAQRYADDLARYKEQGVTWTSVTAEQIALEERQVAASILQQNLVAKKASLSPSPDPAVQARYEQARRELLDQLQASANITKAVPAL